MNTNEILPSVSSRYRGDKGTAPIEYSEQGVNIRGSDSREIYETRLKPPSAKPKQLMSTTLSTYPKQDRKARSYGKSLELIEAAKALAMLIGSFQRTVHPLR
jgi:hypothetical protein